MTNKTLGLNHYDCIKYSSISDLLGQANINTENQLMVLSDSSWKYCTYTGRSTGAYIIFYQGGKLTMAHMFQYQLLNQLQKVSIMQHALKEWL